MALGLIISVITALALTSCLLCQHACLACYVFPADARDPCRDKRCSFGAQCVPSLDGLTARCQCPERCDNYGDSVDSTPLCANDGQDYANRCEMRRAACSEMRDIEKLYDGKCDPCDGFQCPAGQLCKLDDYRRPACQCNTICSRDISPVCASDGRTYSNECIMQSETCKNRLELRVIHRGECSSGDGLHVVGDEYNSRGISPCAVVKCAAGEYCQVDRSGRARCSCPPPCDKIVRPVCGSDGMSYDNECDMRRKACLDKRVITVAHIGQCPNRRKSRSKDLPMEDGPLPNTRCQISPCVSHTCPDGARCIIKHGRAHCECLKCDRNEKNPVCGSDGKSYDSECLLKAENCKQASNISVTHAGLCADVCAKVECREGETCIDGECIQKCSDISHCVDNAPVCASDGKTYPNECAMNVAACIQRITLQIIAVGKCSDEFSGSLALSEMNCDDKTTCLFGGRCLLDAGLRTSTCECQFNCDAVRAPRCGSDGKVYGNECNMLEESCRQQVAITVQSSDNCYDFDEELCDGADPVTNSITGVRYVCDGPNACPSGTYCHRLHANTSACCHLDEASSTDCALSPYGCCPDDSKLAAFGPDGAGCPSVCQCNPLGSHVLTCDPLSRQCLCKPSVGGPRCDRCEPTFWGFLKISVNGSMGCLPCNCDVDGSERDDCDQMTGKCSCRVGYTGDKCEVCIGAENNDCRGGLTPSSTHSVYPTSRRSSHAYKSLIRTKSLNQTSSKHEKSRQVRHSERAVTFSGYTYLHYKNAVSKQLKRQRFNSYEMDFRTHSSAGLLLIEHKSMTANADYLAIAVNKGRVEASFNLGKERVSNGLATVRSDVNVHDGSWHNVVFSRDGRFAWLSVDYETPVNVTSTPGATSLDTNGLLWIGGPGKGSPIGLTAAYHRGLVGCIRRVLLNKQRLHLIDDLIQSSVNNSTISFCAS